MMKKESSDVTVIRSKMYIALSNVHITLNVANPETSKPYLHFLCD